MTNSLTATPDSTAATYRAVPLQILWRSQPQSTRGILLGAWLASLILSIALGLASIVYQWSGLPLHFAGVDLHITIYPPLIFCTLWTLWFGFWWGFIPAYMATLVLALYSGMPVGWSLLFAFADPLALAVFALTYRAVPISCDLRSANAVLFFVLIAFVGGIFGSTGSFIWTYTNALGVHELLPIWEGWWLGAFVQNLMLVAPLLFLFTPALTRWRDRNLAPLVGHAREARAVLIASGAIVGGVLLYLHITITLGRNYLADALAGNDTVAWRNAAQVVADSSSVLYGIVFILILFIAFFGGQLFSYWTASLQHSAQELSAANARLRSEMTQRKQTEYELQIYAEKLRAANASKDRLFSLVAHDLRGPVGAVVSLLQIIRNQIQALEQRELTERFHLLQDSMEQLFRLLENLLQWSRLQLGQWRSKAKTVGLSEAVQTAVEAHALRALQKGVAFKVDIDPELQVHTDPDMLQIVLRNLFANALKFTGDGGGVTVVATADPEGVAISVRDSGVGMTQEAVKGLFTTTEVNSMPGTDGEQGTGIGLLLCKELLEKQGSGLWIDSRPGRGTTVRFTLPPGSQPLSARKENDDEEKHA